jgi:hypothetical protein
MTIFKFHSSITGGLRSPEPAGLYTPDFLEGGAKRNSFMQELTPAASPFFNNNLKKPLIFP